MKTSSKWIVALLALLAGCATPAKKEPVKSASAETEASAPAKTPEYPKQALSQAILYHTLISEIALQRGEFNFAVATLLELANNTRDPRYAQRATEAALFARNEAQALEAARLWLALEPDAVAARQSLAALLVSQRKLSEAKAHLQFLLAADSANPGRGFLQLNALLSKQVDKQAVLALVKELAEPYPTLPEAHIAIAQAAWNAGDTELGLAAARQALALRPDWEAGVLFQGQMLQSRSASEAAEFYRAFLKKNPKAREVRMAYARALIANKEYTAARAEFETLTKEFPGNPEISFAVGLLALQVGDHAAADTYLKQAIEYKHRDPEAIYLYLGQANEDRKQYAQAADWYKKVSGGESYLPAQLKYAGVLAKQGQIDEARKQLQSITPQSNQQRVQITLAEVQLLRDAKRFDEAYKLLDKALEKLPNYPDLLYERAMTAEKLNRFADMEKDLRKLIQVKPDFAHAYNALGYSLADRNERLDEAQQLLEKALALAPDDAFILDSVGWLQYRRGELDKAAATLRRAFVLRPDPEIAAHLGEVLWAQGQKAQADQIWRNALQQHPSNETLLGIMQKFQR